MVHRALPERLALPHAPLSFYVYIHVRGYLVPVPVIIVIVCACVCHGASLLKRPRAFHQYTHEAFLWKTKTMFPIEKRNNFSRIQFVSCWKNENPYFFFECFSLNWTIFLFWLRDSIFYRQNSSLSRGYSFLFFFTAENLGFWICMIFFLGSCTWNASYTFVCDFWHWCVTAGRRPKELLVPSTNLE